MRLTLEVIIYLEKFDDGHVTYQSLWDANKTAFEGKFIIYTHTLSIYNEYIYIYNEYIYI